MAVLTRAVECGDRGRVARIAVTDGVALLAEPRTLHFQEKFVVGAMGVVTVEAILAHRRVLP